MNTRRQVLTQAEIEFKIEDLCDSLESLVEEYADVCEAQVDAEMAYKHKHGQTTIGFANSDVKMTVAEKSARADLHCHDELYQHKMTAARKEAMKESLRSVHARIDALRTLSANARAAT